jgi:hypothetical protein
VSLGWKSVVKYVKFCQNKALNQRCILWNWSKERAETRKKFGKTAESEKPGIYAIALPGNT